MTNLGNDKPGIMYSECKTDYSVFRVHAKRLPLEDTTCKVWTVLSTTKISLTTSQISDICCSKFREVDWTENFSAPFGWWLVNHSYLQSTSFTNEEQPMNERITLKMNNSFVIFTSFPRRGCANLYLLLIRFLVFTWLRHVDRNANCQWIQIKIVESSGVRGKT